MAKLKLKSVWRKWAQNQKKTQTNLVTSLKGTHVLLTSAGTVVANLIFPNDGVEHVSWKHSDDYIAEGKNVNEALAAY